MTAKNDGVAIVLFLVLVTLLSAIFWTLMIASGHVGAGGGRYVEGLMWCPAVAAFVTITARRLDIGSLGLSSIGGRYAIAGYLIPLAYAAVAYGLVWGLGFGSFPNLTVIAKLSARLGWQVSDPATFVVLYFVLMATTAIVSGTAHALGEEIGWRGFLAPRMVRQMGFTWGAVITGIIWTAWHMPILLFADYNSGNPWWFALPCFAVMVVGLSVILTWLRLRSNSVWPCAIFHGSHNLFIQAFFTPLTAPHGAITRYAIDEFGIAVPAVVAIVALIVWRYRAGALAVAALQPT
jgi:membrane protease YdiL (CAAX protease family)